MTQWGGTSKAWLTGESQYTDSVNEKLIRSAKIEIIQSSLGHSSHYGILAQSYKYVPLQVLVQILHWRLTKGEERVDGEHMSAHFPNQKAENKS